MVEKLKPEVIHVFSPAGLGAFVLDWLHSQPVPIVHDIFDTFLPRIYESDPWFKRCMKKHRSLFGRAASAALKALASSFIRTAPSSINLDDSYFRSSYLKRTLAQKGLATNKAPVIYHGLRPPTTPAPDILERPPDIVFAGRVSPEKGLHVFLEAAMLLKDVPVVRKSQITIAGPVTDRDYGLKIQELAKELHVFCRVHFLGHLTRSETLDVLRRHRLFVFPVLWDEPFGLAPLEAMSLGLSVIATGTGGSAEYLVHDRNCLIVRRDDPQDLANALLRLLSDGNLCGRLSQGALDTAKCFELERSIDQIEEHLSEVVGRSSQSQHSRDEGGPAQDP